MFHLRLNLPLAVLCCAIALFSASIIGCGDDDDDDDDDNGGVVNPPVDDPSDNEPPDDGDTDPPDGDPPVEEGVSFQNDIEPILDARCAIPGCHSGGNPTGGLNMETYANFQRGGQSGPTFIPGDGQNSRVVQRIDGGGMPQIGPPLDDDQIQLFIDWIDEGAEDN